MKAPVEIAERHTEVGGVDVLWRQAGDAPILYLHGVPVPGWQWEPFLARCGGIAPDLPGFGRSGKPGDFDYTIAGYDRFVEQFCDHAGLERVSLVMHDWGSVGLAFAQRRPERVERLVLSSCVPFVPGYRWHRVARIWRTSAARRARHGLHHPPRRSAASCRTRSRSAPTTSSTTAPSGPC